MANNVLSYGFYDHTALANQRINDVSGVSVYDMVTQSAAMYTEHTNALIARLCDITDKYKWKYKLPRATDLQPATGSSVPDLVKGCTSYDVALPIQMGMYGYGFDHVAEAKLTLAELNQETLAALSADARWLKRHILAALFTNTTWSFTDPEKGTLTIQPLANADGNLYPLVSGDTEDSQHFVAQASAIDDSHNPYPTIHDQLAKHPSNMVSNATPVVVYIATSLKATTKALANFVAVADMDIKTGSGTDVVGVSQARLDEIRGPGNEVIGKCDECWIVEWDAIPSGYMIAHATGGGPVLGMRQDPEASLQGFYPKNETQNAVISKTYFYRRAGFGVLNRVGGLVYRVGNGSYAIPTGYTAPLAA